MMANELPTPGKNAILGKCKIAVKYSNSLCAVSPKYVTSRKFVRLCLRCNDYCSKDLSPLRTYLAFKLWWVKQH